MRIRPFVVRCAPPLAWAAATVLLLLGLGALWPDRPQIPSGPTSDGSSVSTGQAVGLLVGLLVALRGRGLRDWVLGPVLGFAVASLDRAATRWLRLAGLEGEACWVFPVAGLLAGWLIAWQRRSLRGAFAALVAVAAADAIGWLDFAVRGQPRAIGILREPWERDQTAILVFERVPEMPATPSLCWYDYDRFAPSDVAAVPADPWKRVEESSFLAVLAEAESATNVERVADEFARAIQRRDSGAPIHQGVQDEGPLLPTLSSGSKLLCPLLDALVRDEYPEGQVIASRLVSGDRPRIRILLLESPASLPAVWAWSHLVGKVTPGDTPERCGVAWVNGAGAPIQDPGAPWHDAYRLSEWLIPCKWRWIGRDLKHRESRDFVDLGHEAEAVRGGAWFGHPCRLARLTPPSAPPP